ncbi:unnamed protein product [Rhizophagus irregularis]|nr:unnamed protein product [Rhizophagus irregularis]
MINNNLVIIFVLAFFLNVAKYTNIKSTTRRQTNYINYKMKVVETDQTPTQNFGINVQGNHPLQYPGILGLLTYATNFTGISNPQNTEQKFTLSISFVYGVLPLPLPTVSPKQTNTTSSIPSTSKSTPTNDIPENPPFFYATNNGFSNVMSNINIIRLLLIIVVVLLSTIFIISNN